MYVGGHLKGAKEHPRESLPVAPIPCSPVLWPRGTSVPNLQPLPEMNGRHSMAKAALPGILSHVSSQPRAHLQWQEEKMPVMFFLNLLDI